MARRKKPDNESTEESSIRHILETIADTATRSEKVSWDRKMDNMVSLLAKLKPIEDQILDLMSQKTPIIDQVSELRREMVKECIHPYTHLVHKGENMAECKFCGRSFSVLNDGNHSKT